MFLPEPRRGFQLDQHMRTSLADSLAYLFDVAGPNLALTDIDFSDVCANIRAHRVPPGLFGRYYDLVPAITAGWIEQARSLAREIAAMSTLKPEFSIAPLTDAVLGSDASRYARLLGGEQVESISFGPPGEADWAGFLPRAQEALQMIARFDPALAEEIGGLVVQLVGAVPSQQNTDFGTASSFMLWGAVVANLRYQKKLPDVIGGLIHEAAHLLLFGLSIDGPIVLNPLAERYSSPLRKDPRPMDGIYHATFVTARLHYFFSQVRTLQPEIFENAYEQTIDQYLDVLKTGFERGCETIARHGQLSERGQQIIADTSEVMKAAA